MKSALKLACVGGFMAAACALHLPASAAVIFSDDFNRTNSSTVGNGWTELGNGVGDVAIANNSLRLRDGLSGSPDAAAASMILDSSGYDGIAVEFTWRSLDANGRSSPDLKLSWALDPRPPLTSQGAWTQVFSGSDGGTGWHTETIQLGAGAAHTLFNIMFWTSGVDAADEGFRIDYVKVTGNPMPAVAPLLEAPLPASIPLLLGAIVMLGILGWRSRSSA